MGDEPFYNLHLKNGQESGFLVIKELGDQAGAIADARRTNVNFINMITKIEFLDKKEHEELNSTLFFMEKYKIESMIDKCLAPHAR
jgi:hypothetical protein